MAMMMIVVCFWRGEWGSRGKLFGKRLEGSCFVHVCDDCEGTGF